MSDKRKEQPETAPRFVVAADGRSVVRLEDVSNVAVQRFGSNYLVIAFRRGAIWDARVECCGIRLAECATEKEAQLKLRALAALIDPQAIVLD